MFPKLMIDKAYIKLLTAVLIIILAYADYSAMRILFDAPEADLLPKYSKLYSFIFALCLEGIPAFMGNALSIMKDKTRYKVNEKTIAEIGFRICSIGITLAFFLAFILRAAAIYEKGGLGAFGAGDYDDFPIDIFLMFSPFLTSILAFAASWFSFRTENEEVLEKKIKFLYENYINEQKNFLSDLNKLQDARTTLWTNISDEPMPKVFDSFKKESFSNIRKRLIDTCSTAYPVQIKHFDASIENMLEIYIKEMASQRSAANMNLKNVLEEYDKNQESDEYVWNYDKAKESLEKELRELLDRNAQPKKTSLEESEAPEGLEL